MRILKQMGNQVVGLLGDWAIERLANALFGKNGARAPQAPSEPGTASSAEVPPSAGAAAEALGRGRQGRTDTNVQGTGRDELYDNIATEPFVAGTGHDLTQNATAEPMDAARRDARQGSPAPALPAGTPAGPVDSVDTGKPWPPGKQDEAGFTLLEMMAVIAIIGVLAAIAIPRYQNHVARSQVASAYMVLKGQQINVEDLLLRGEAPTLAALGFNGNSVRQPHGEWQVSDNGDLRYTFGEGVSSRIDKGSWLRLAPLAQGGEGWRCDASSELDPGLLPAGCNKAVGE